ncbi:HNH endonuclease [Alteromonas sp. P256]|uniref:HNH endonuclease n=1 Tax=Alteromonas sp. P256 TaxID=3117399 RepID=UPI002FE1609B
MALHHVTFRAGSTITRRKYKRESGALNATNKFLMLHENTPISVVTIISPHQPVRIFRCQSQLEEVTSKSVSFYNTKRWLTLRFKAFDKYGQHCMCCNRAADDGVRIEVDHVYPRSKFPALEYELANLQILCNLCNAGKSNILIKDFRSQDEKIALDRKLAELNLKIIKIFEINRYSSRLLSARHLYKDICRMLTANCLKNL